MAKKDRPLKKLSAKKRLRRIAELVEPFRVTSGKRFRLRDYDPDATTGRRVDKDEAKEYLQRGVELLAEHAGPALRAGPVGRAADLPGDGRGRQGRHDQARDVGRQPAGLPGLLVQGARRARSSTTTSSGGRAKCLPERGRIGIFNRSYYEEVLVVRVHPEILEKQKLPDAARRRSASGRSASRTSTRFERYLARNGIVDPQVLPARLEGGAEASASSSASTSRRRTGSSRLADAKEREHWDEYMAAYEDAIRADGGAKHAPWYVVPADNKWFTRLVVAGAIYRRAREAAAALSRRRPGEEEGARGGAGRAMGETQSAVRDKKRPVAKKRAAAKKRAVAKRRSVTKKRSVTRSATRPRPAVTPTPVRADEQTADTGATAADEELGRDYDRRRLRCLAADPEALGVLRQELDVASPGRAPPARGSPPSSRRTPTTRGRGAPSAGRRGGCCASPRPRRAGPPTRGCASPRASRRCGSPRCGWPSSRARCRGASPRAAGTCPRPRQRPAAPGVEGEARAGCSGSTWRRFSTRCTGSATSSGA